jgi:hypothetical protein
VVKQRKTGAGSRKTELRSGNNYNKLLFHKHQLYKAKWLKCLKQIHSNTKDVPRLSHDCPTTVPRLSLGFHSVSLRLAGKEAKGISDQHPQMA